MPRLPKARPMASRREIFGWAMFDFASQAYTTLIVTVIFGVIFTRIIVGDGPDFRLGNFLWSLSLSVSYALVALAAPVCGAIMDYAAARKRFLFASCVLTVISTACLYFVTPGLIWLGVVLIVVSNFGYALGESFIAGFLPGLGPPDKLGRISGFGWALGYVGGLLSTGIVLLGLGGVTPCNFNNMRLVGPLAAFFFLASAVPTFLWLREPGSRASRQPWRGYVFSGFQRLGWTFRELRRFRDLAVFLVSLFFAMAGLSIVISFAFIYGDQVIEWEPRYQMLMFVLTQIFATAGALGFGLLQDRIGAKRTYDLTLLLWIAAVVLIFATPWVAATMEPVVGFAVHPQQVYLVVGCVAGLGLGAVQSSARTLVGRMSPLDKASEFFGFWGMAVKLAAIFGILGLGALQALFGLQLAVLLCLVFFATALAVSILVDEERGERAAVL